MNISLGNATTTTARQERDANGGLQNAYSPAGLETYLMRNAGALGFNVPFEGFAPLSGRGYSEFFNEVNSMTNWTALRDRSNIPSGCDVWLDSENPMYTIANTFKYELI